jgi:hypothetical protein
MASKATVSLCNGFGECRHTGALTFIVGRSGCSGFTCNRAICLPLAHNICMLIQSAHNMSVELKFHGTKGNVRHYVVVGYSCSFRGGGGCSHNIFHRLFRCPRAAGRGDEAPARKWWRGPLLLLRPTVTADDGQDRALALGWRLATQPT